MKTNLLIATALLLSVAGFSQQTEPASKQQETPPASAEKGGIDASVKASTSARVTTTAAGTVENQAANTKKQAEKVSSSVEKKAASEKKSATDKGRGSIDANTSANASIKANSGASAGSGDNKLSQDAYLNAGVNGSSSDIKNRLKDQSQEGQSTVKAKTSESLKTTASLKKETDERAVRTTERVKYSAKQQPVSVKVHSHIKTNTSLKIK